MVGRVTHRTVFPRLTCKLKAKKESRAAKPSPQTSILHLLHHLLHRGQDTMDSTGGSAWKLLYSGFSQPWQAQILRGTNRICWCLGCTRKYWDWLTSSWSSHTPPQSIYSFIHLVVCPVPCQWGQQTTCTGVSWGLPHFLILYLPPTFCTFLLPPLHRLVTISHSKPC